MYFTDAGLACPLAHDLVAVPPAGRGVCRVCRDLIPDGYAHCRHCRRTRGHADVVAPISLCIRGGALHAALRGYNDGTQQRVRDLHLQRLAALLDDFLGAHERCLAKAATTRAFDAVTVVPSSSPVRDALRPSLRRLAAELPTTRSRYVRLLKASGAVPERDGFDVRRYLASPNAAGQRILLLEDTWVTGGRAQSAAAALRTAGALSIGVVAVGQFVNAAHDDNGTRIGGLAAWSCDSCALCVKDTP